MFAMRNHDVQAYFLAAVLLVSTLTVTVSVVPALANESNNAIMKILDTANAEANDELQELQQKGLEIPQNADSLYSAALSKHEAAMQALNSGNTVSARIHAIKALDLFKSLFDLLTPLEQEQEEDDDANLIDEIDQDISNSQRLADNLRRLASANNISSISFSSYDSAINASRDALSEGNLKEAEEQFDFAQELLKAIQNDMQQAVQDDGEKSEKAREFALKTSERLGKIIADLKEGSSPDDFQSGIINELLSIISQLEKETDIERIIEITDDSSELQTVIDEYNAYRVENFEYEKYYGDIQEDIAALQAIASELNIRIQSSEIDGLLSSVREKIEAGQEDDAAEELDRLDSLLDEIEDIVQEFTSVIEEIEETRNTALALRSQAVNNTEALEEIDRAISLLEKADSAVMVAAQVGIGFETISDVHAQLELASRLTHEADDILDEVEGNVDERSESIMKTISEYEDWANDLRDKALEADNNSEAIKVVEEALSLIEQARNAALGGNLDQAESYLDSARVQLENAEQIIESEGDHEEDG